MTPLTSKTESLLRVANMVVTRISAKGGYFEIYDAAKAALALPDETRAASPPTDPRMDRLWEIHKIATQSRVLPEDVDRIATLSEGYAPVPLPRYVREDFGPGPRGDEEFEAVLRAKMRALSAELPEHQFPFPYDPEKDGAALLGYATTAQLLEELAARARLAGYDMYRPADRQGDARHTKI